MGGESIRDMVERIESGVDRFDGKDDGSEDFSSLFDTAGKAVVVTTFELCISDFEGVGQVGSDLAHTAEPTGGGAV